MQNPTRLLLVEDDDDQRTLFTLALQPLGLEIVSVDNADEALQRLKAAPYDLVITDWYLPNTMGDELIRTLKAHQPELITVLMSSHSQVREAAHECGATGWFRKNDGILRLRALVSAVLQAGGLCSE